MKRWPSRSQLKHLFKVLTKKERVAFLVFFAAAVASGTYLVWNVYTQNTKIVAARGGTHIEGAVGQPRFINPLYANSDIDRDLTQLVFSSLMGYDEELNIIPLLAERYEISEDRKSYTFSLKENLLWNDGASLTAEDVLFTIKTIQNPVYKSPLRANWVGVEVEKIDDLTITFILQKPYHAFLENTTVPLLPKHIWQTVAPENFPLEVYNLKPVGSGPYKVKEIKQDKPGTIKSITLVPNALYAAKAPAIAKITFLFFSNTDDLVASARKGKITGFSVSSFGDDPRWNQYDLGLPRYFAVFFNPQQSEILSQKDVRVALNYGVDKRKLVQKILKSGKVDERIVHSPILPELYGFPLPSAIYELNLEKAKELLDKADFRENSESGFREKQIVKEPAFEFKSDLRKESQGREVRELQKCLANFGTAIYPDGIVSGYFGPKTKEAVIRFQEKYAADILEPWGFTSGTGLVSKTTRKKLNELCFDQEPEETIPLAFSLFVVDQPELVEIANLLQQQWEAIGVRVEVKQLPIDQLEQDVLRPRNYEALLFGEVLGAIPDPLPFWHSSQKRDPGLNLAFYENEDADELLEQVRASFDPAERAEKLAEFQDIVIEDAPVVFLYTIDYPYYVSKLIKGVSLNKIVDPAKRFSAIEDWYIETKRVWK